MIVDVITNRLANPHNKLMRAVGNGAFPLAGPTYVTAYAPTDAAEGNAADVWALPAAVGEVIPAVPLALRRGPLVVPDLDATYTEAVTDSDL